MNIDALNGKYGIAGAARFFHGKGDLEMLELTTPKGSCELALHGAHVTAYTPADEEPVIWMSQHSEYADGKPIRGGIPVCFPWFGVHETDASLPSHGYVRLSSWRVESVTRESADRIAATLSTESHVSTRSMWPHEFGAQLSVTLGDSLSVALSVTNTGEASYAITEALHTYFAVSDIRFVTLEGLEGASYLDKLLETDEPFVQRGSVQFTAETDRPYLDTDATCIIDDPGKQRKIRIEKSGSLTTVVWNPWIAKARRMDDLGDDEWTGMLCVETANALSNAVTIEPGETHTMATTISVEH